MSKPIALLAYQDADLEKQQLEADLRTTENRVRLNKLAKFIKQLVPRARIFGTSTSAVISEGKLLQNRCILSVTQMSKGHICAWFAFGTKRRNEILLS